MNKYILYKYVILIKTSMCGLDYAPCSERCSSATCPI